MIRLTDDDSGILLEEVNERLKLVQESLTLIRPMRRDMASIKRNLSVLADESPTFKASVKDLSLIAAQHEIRISKLEAR